jgi:TRAF3-interacting protein 1
VLRTIEVLQPLFPKPRLSDKLLAKPPFRFLFDVVMALVQGQGLFPGLYSGVELDGEALSKEKELKTAWLEKLINAVGVHLHTHTGARARSIVAGAEADKTNEMLQLLAVVVGLGSPTDEAVRRVLAGEVQPEADGSRSGFIAPPAAAPAPAPSPAWSAPAVAPVPARIAQAPAPAPSMSPARAVPAPAPAARAEDVPLSRALPSAAAPASARAAKEAAQPAAREPSAAPVFLAEGAGEEEEEEEGEGEGGAGARSTAAAAGGAAGGGAGKHTRDIIQATSGEGKEGDGEGGIRMGRLRKGGAGAGDKGGASVLSSPAELEALRSQIQALAASVVPLGRALDYVPEDVEDMRAELRGWQAEYEKGREAMDRARRESEEAAGALRRGLAEATERVSQAESRRVALRLSVASNDERIAALLRSVMTK